MYFLLFAGLQMIKDVVHNLNISDSSEFSEETTTAKGQSDWIDDLIHKVNSSTEWSLSPSSLEPVLARVKEIKI